MEESSSPTTNRLALAAINTVTEEVHSPRSGVTKECLVALIALTVEKNRFVFQSFPLVSS